MSDPLPTQGSHLLTAELIAPFLYQTYGEGGYIRSLVQHLAGRIESFQPRDPAYHGDVETQREKMIMHVCWDWQSGGSTAESVARRIEAALVEAGR